MLYTLVIDAPHAETGTMKRTIDTHSVLEVAQNIVAVTSENVGREIDFKVTATRDDA